MHFDFFECVPILLYLSVFGMYAAQRFYRCAVVYFDLMSGRPASYTYFYLAFVLHSVIVVVWQCISTY